MSKIPQGVLTGSLREVMLMGQSSFRRLKSMIRQLTTIRIMKGTFMVTPHIPNRELTQGEKGEKGVQIGGQARKLAS